MAKLTKRGIGILDGFKSDKGRVELTQKLGTIEHRAEQLAGEACDFACKYLGEADDDELRTICEACPMTRLMELIQ